MSNSTNHVLQSGHLSFSVRHTHSKWPNEVNQLSARNTNILNYILFGIVLIKLYEESRFMGYLNSLLKINDIIISQDTEQVLKYSPALKTIITKELELVKYL